MENCLALASKWVVGRGEDDERSGTRSLLAFYFICDLSIYGQCYSQCAVKPNMSTTFGAEFGHLVEALYLRRCMCVGGDSLGRRV